MKPLKLSYQLFADIIAGIFMFLFLYTAITKISNPEKLEMVIRQTSYLSQHAKFLTQALPVLEILVVVLLFFEKAKMTGLVMSFLFMICFTVYIAVMLMTSRDLPCSCGGIVESMTWQQQLILNLFLVGLSYLGIFFQRHKSVQKTFSIPIQSRIR